MGLIFKWFLKMCLILHRIAVLYPHMRCPTLVVRGALDPIVPQRWAEEVTRRLPRGRLIVLPGVPHTANLEAPLELLRVTKPFFDEERQPGGAQITACTAGEAGYSSHAVG